MQEGRLSIKASSNENNMSIGKDKKRSSRRGNECVMKRPTTENDASINQRTAISRHISDGSSAASAVISCSQLNDWDLADDFFRPSTPTSSITSWFPWLEKESSTLAAPETKKAQDYFNDQSSSSSQPSTPTLMPLQEQEQPQKKQHFSFDQVLHPLRRVDSGEWVKQYKKERIDKINFNNVFGGTGDPNINEIPVLPPPEECPSPRPYENLSRSSMNHLLNSPGSTVSSSTSASSSSAEIPLPLSSTTTTITEPTPNDVICGRGGKANNHPGNVSFRTEALKLRSWYEASSKSEKFTISSLLVDFVREKGGRFLKRDGNQPGKWFEADANDVRKKASQALREGRLKELTKANGA
jgi:hypothetical protein